jgi:hypothetical protein
MPAVCCPHRQAPEALRGPPHRVRRPHAPLARDRGGREGLRAAYPVPAVMSGSTSSGRGPNFETDVMGHVWTAPGWQVLSSRVQQWSEQPCVRPVSAVHMTAGHNALRGSGPGHNHAFDNALAQVGCPDRRIDRLCITCCSPFPTVTSRRTNARRDLCHAASATGSL